jgi:acyl-coenzyme A synthetase/AMP-(fatty) acid ligase
VTLNLEGDDDGPLAPYEPADDWELPAIIATTSGTTGTPKFSIATHLQYYFRTTILPEMPRRAPQTRYLSTLPMCFSAGRGIALSYLFRGDCVVIYASLFGAKEFVEIVEKYQVTAGLVAPSVVRQLLQIAPADGLLLPSLDSLICGGGPLFADEKREVARRVTPNLFEFYGATAVGTVSVLRPNVLLQRPDSVGQPNALIEVEIVDDSGTPVPVGTVGRLRCRGPGLGDPADQEPGAEALKDGWYYPGEIGSLDEAGFLYLQGRESEVIIRGGAKIHPSEVEAALLAHPGVAEAAVIGVRAPDNDEAVVAFVTTKHPVEPGQLVAHCRSRLTPYKLPREIRVVAAMPHNVGGKIDKIELTRQYAATSKT